MNDLLHAVPKVEEKVFLVPMHGGIWTLCIDLSESDLKRLGHVGFPHTTKCISYLADTMINIAVDDVNWQHNDVEVYVHPHMSKFIIIFVYRLYIMF